MKSRIVPAVLRSAASVMVGALLLADLAPAQNIPNPLVRPPRGSGAVAAPGGNAPAPAAAAEAPRGAAAAAPRGRAAAGGEGLPAETTQEKTPSERLASLYVSAVIGDRAVLRSLDVRVVPGLAGGISALDSPTGSAGGSNGGGAGGGGGGGGAGAAGGAAGGLVTGLRSQSYIVRNGEVMTFLDRLRLLVRVRDTTVTLFDVTDVPDGQYDPLDLMDRGFPVAFRGSVDSVQMQPPTPLLLTPPGEGVDGAAFDRARDTSRGSSSTGASSTNTSSGNTGGTGNP